MDTHVAPSPEIGDHEPVLSARLPGEPNPDTGFSSDTTGRTDKLARDSAPRRRTKRRAGLLSGAVIVGIVTVAGGAFVLSPYNHIVPIPRRVSSTVHDFAASAGLNIDQPFAPSASLASVKLPPQPSTVVAQRYVAKPPDQDLREVLAMHAGATLPGAPATSAAPPNKPVNPVAAAAAATPNVALANPVPGAPADYVPHEPGATIAVASKPPEAPRPDAAGPAGPAPHPPANDITQAVVAAATGPAEPASKASQGGIAVGQGRDAPVAHPDPQAETAAAAQVPPKPAAAVVVGTTAAPPDAVTQALHLRAEPMSNQDQVQVLELVTQMATMVRDLKSQNASLRADFAKTTADGAARLADFERRLDLAEARTAVAAAVLPAGPSAVPSSSLAPAPATIQPAVATSSIAVTRPEAALPTTAPTDAKRYRVQAASPGLALLTEVARGGGDGAQIQITVGDTIPGWGKVKSVSQLGTSWVVSTEHGVIR